MSIIQSVMGTSLTISGGGGGPSPDGTYFNTVVMLPWGSVGINGNKPVYTAAYALPDTLNTDQVWEFNGADQLMTTDLNFSFTQLYINFWFYPTAVGCSIMTIQGQLQENTNFHHTALEMNIDGTVTGGFWNGASLSSMTTVNTVNVNAWNHIYMRHNSTQALIQLNGNAGVTSTHVWDMQTNPLVIGFGTTSITNAGNPGRFQGFLSNVRISSTSMASNYDLTRSRYEPPPLFVYNDFTVEWWQKAESTGNNVSPWTIGFLPSTLELSLRYWGTGPFAGKDMIGINDGFALASQPTKNHYTNTWEHMAVVRKDGNIKVYSDGVNYLTLTRNDSTVNTALDNLTAQFVVGSAGQAPPGSFNHYRGYLKDVHIIKGYAKYSTNFTPPSVPVQSQNGSVFLLPTTSAGNEYDDVIGYKTATLTYTPLWTTDIPFTAAGPYTQFTNQTGFGGGQHYITFAGGTYNADLANVKAGWSVSVSGNTVATVNLDAVTGLGPSVSIGVDVDPTSFIPGTVTFTQPALGGSLYFDEGEYINYGSSVDFAFDIDNIITGNLSLDLNVNNYSSYNPASGSNWNDMSPGNFDFTLYGAPYYTAGSRSSLNFNGTSQYATGPVVNLLPNSAYTKMVWFNLNDVTSDNNLVSSDGGGHFMFFSGGSTLWVGHTNVMPYQGSGAFGSTVTFSAGTWYCVAVTYSIANGISLYINGILNNNTAMAQHAGNGSTNIACYGAGGNLLNGKIGRVLCYTQELTASEVLQNFNATRNRYGI